MVFFPDLFQENQMLSKYIVFYQSSKGALECYDTKWLTCTEQKSIASAKTPRKPTFLPYGHLDFESAVTAQSDKFKGFWQFAFMFQQTQSLA